MLGPYRGPTGGIQITSGFQSGVTSSSREEGSLGEIRVSQNGTQGYLSRHSLQDTKYSKHEK